jgi:hypothetical protein
MNALQVASLLAATLTTGLRVALSTVAFGLLVWALYVSGRSSVQP